MGPALLYVNARKTSLQTIRWPTIFIPVPNGPGITVSNHYVGLLLRTLRGRSWFHLFTIHFSGRPDMYAVAAAQVAATDTAEVLIAQYVPLWRCLVALISDNGLQRISKSSSTTYERLGLRKINTRSYHTGTDGGVERGNHTTAGTSLHEQQRTTGQLKRAAHRRRISLQRLRRRLHRPGH